MLDLLDEVYVANQVTMTRDVFKGSILIVEGGDDAIIFGRFVDLEDKCRIIVAHGKPNAIGALKRLRSHGHDSLVLVVVDADFWHMTGLQPTDKSILVTDYHDIEILMIMSRAFDYVVSENAKYGDLQSAEASWGRSFRDQMLLEASRIGLLRYVNDVNSYSLSFSSVDLNDYVDRAQMVIDLDEYMSGLISRSRASCTRTQLETQVAAISLSEHQIALVSSGHDCMQLMALAFCGCIGLRRGSSIDQEGVSAQLRLAFDSDEFSRTSLYRAVVDWEDRTGATVLRV